MKPLKVAYQQQADSPIFSTKGRGLPSSSNGLIRHAFVPIHEVKGKSGDEYQQHQESSQDCGTSLLLFSNLNYIQYSIFYSILHTIPIHKLLFSFVLI